MFSSLYVICPFDLFSRFARIDNNVDFPHPEGPTIAIKSCLFTLKDISLIAATSPRGDK